MLPSPQRVPRRRRQEHAHGDQPTEVQRRAYQLHNVRLQLAAHGVRGQAWAGRTTQPWVVTRWCSAHTGDVKTAVYWRKNAQRVCNCIICTAIYHPTYLCAVKAPEATRFSKLR